MKRRYTLRLGYLYITCGCALLSGALLLAVRRICALLYSWYSPESAALFIRLSNGAINTVGRAPFSVILYLTGFGLLYVLRSGILAGDMKTLLRASRELAEGGLVPEVAVRSGGELAELAANLQRIGRNGSGDLPEAHGSYSPALSGPTERVDGGEALALVLRTRRIIRELSAAEAEISDRESALYAYLESAQAELQHMERSLESLVAS
ncbi:hypothetical protein J2Z22_003652 [Paenibacillus forsythiae]|uniref:HAMP domain-containing protein n=1 Tax=Paenibacillus forsythiae TaxID=365616 RepID=A0ABU3HB58_9BACL|nr:hypothetical protein [Paenibacillus forsythiae]MDT3428062.1 hypothetical protein [Paenibacillus forsythiae]